MALEDLKPSGEEQADPEMSQIGETDSDEDESLSDFLAEGDEAEGGDQLHGDLKKMMKMKRSLSVINKNYLGSLSEYKI